MLLNLIGADDLAASENLLAVFHNRHKPNVEVYQRAVEKGMAAELIDCQGRGDWRSIRNIRQLIHARAIDIIHTHGYKADLYGYLAARCEGRPVVATCHNWLSGGAALKAYNFVDRQVLKRFDAIGAVSDAVAEKLVSLGVDRERIAVIPNGIDVDRFKIAAPSTTGPRKEQVIGFVGRLDLQKGFAYLLRAVSSLRHHLPGLRLLIVGEGPDRGRIEGIIRQEGLSAIVTLAGQKADMASIYQSIDVLVLPSLNEGLPLTLLEAMAASRPVIATRVGAVPKVIIDGVTGLLVEPADESALASAISQLLSDPGLYSQLAQRARAYVERHYTAGAMADRYRELYAGVMRGRGKKEQPIPGIADAAHALSPVAAGSESVKKNSAG